MDEPIKILGERVRERRKWKRLSQGEASEQAELDQSYWSQLEGGKYENPGLRTLLRVAQALETSIAYLVGETDDPRPILEPGQAAHNADDPFGGTDLTAEDIQDLERAFLEIERRRQERRRSMEDGNGGPEKQ